MRPTVRDSEPCMPIETPEGVLTRADAGAYLAGLDDGQSVPLRVRAEAAGIDVANLSIHQLKVKRR